MKIAGYILVGLGGVSTVLGFIGIVGGYEGANLAGLMPLVLGAFLLSQANKKEEEELKKKKWEENNSKN